MSDRCTKYYNAQFPSEWLVFLWTDSLHLIPTCILAFLQPQSYNSFYFSISTWFESYSKHDNKQLLLPELSLAASLYKTGTDLSGFILLLNKREEQLRRQVLQGTNTHWHFHGMDKTFSGFAENLVTESSKVTGKKSCRKSNFF